MLASLDFLLLCVTRASPLSQTASTSTVSSFRKNRVKQFREGRGDRLEDLPPFTRAFAYGMLATFFLIIGLLFLLAPLVMLLITGFFWEAWAAGREWLRAPEGMTAVIATSLILACLGVRIVSWHFSPETSTKRKESLWEKRNK